MYRKTISLVLIAITVMLVTTPAGAITYGEPDENRHPNVGLTLTDINGDGMLMLGCTGTLISPTIFLTAGHCTDFLARMGTSKSWVTFDSVYHPENAKKIAITAFVTHPEFNPPTITNDVGIIILAERVEDVPLGILPPENLLDEMKAAGALRGQTFVNVGYGTIAEFKGHPPLFPRDGVRRFSLSPYAGLTQNSLHLQGNHDATGGGSTCFGDSGGPHFLGDTYLIVSVTSWGDAMCRALDMTQRVDTPSVRAFLDDYVVLP